MPSTQAVSVNLFVGVGSRSEPQHLNEHHPLLLEHMVFKGTEKRPNAILIAQEIEGAGGTLNAYTNKEFTCYWNIVPFDRFPTAIDVAADPCSSTRSSNRRRSSARPRSSSRS
ncbi:insulinase family protein [Tepidiforma flava]|uniref:Insulinase family protein n=1 Tax=Tepidiforma flava TaxID=3004094 RepID=A0ABY7M3M6_9CHLR|nr:insulinase family protein [Tepidiforma flava]WBL34980.1 insulinase family protein [Tepidiforma flava]